MRRLPGSHVPNIRNRSSKQLGWLCGLGCKTIYRSMSKVQLQDIINNEGDKKVKGQSYWNARKELDRRAKKTAKKEGLE